MQVNLTKHRVQFYYSLEYDACSITYRDIEMIQDSRGFWFVKSFKDPLEDSEYPIDIKEFKDYVKAIRIANIDTQYKQQFKELKKLLKKRYKIKFI